jgi:hypothetical protein
MCGWDYRDWDMAQLLDLQNTINWVVFYRQQHPNAQFSKNPRETLTEDDINLLKTTGSWIDPRKDL